MFVLIDGLMEIFNRCYLDENLVCEWCWSCWDCILLFVLLMDVDYFKCYNDCYGYRVGDDCLKKIVYVFVGVCECGSDFVVCYGGEEFVVVLLNIFVKEVIVFVNKLCDVVNKLNIFYKVFLNVDYIMISIGIVIIEIG